MKRIALAAVFLAASPAWAIDFTAPLAQDTGEPFTKCFKLDEVIPQKCAESRTLTLGQFVYEALGADPGSTPADIVTRGKLQLVIRTAKDLELNDGQRDAVKAALFASAAKLGNQPGAIVQALKIIDPASLLK